MEIHNSTTHFSYRIEAKPEGGFIARSSDPGMETLKGTSKEELMQKIQAKAMAASGVNLGSGFKLGGLQVAVTRKVNVTTSSSNSALTGDAAQPNALQSSRSFTSPVQRSSDTTGTMLRVLAAVIALAALAYFFLHR
ncbi:MAG TPA: hypothetical protein VGR50_06490 [Terriglobales bacterium]|nr:hypothetical protein [Terriglobales bacterium]